MARPLFSKSWNLFLEVNADVKSVGDKIGGKVKFNIDNGIFTNACPIRMSYVLNYSGTSIPKPGGKYNVVSGGDAKWYMYRVAEMMTFL
ncbi:MAG TPA: T6SS effector amidase Tae4 family protein, partial [Cellvibrionaceae bacterium]|nr:T6SS effector amidase Tae4 family protein [Cellvibrionaceae bacterium]